MPSALRMTARGAPARRARGGAMVEFVLLNIILIPLLLYAIFLMDAAYLKLDLQETVVSGVWDFSQRNTEPPSFKDVGVLDAPQKKPDNDAAELATAAKGVRLIFADHTSAFDDGADPSQPDGTYNVESYLRGSGDGSPYPSPSGHKKHHTGFGAQYSFRFEKKDDTEEEEDLEDDTQFNCAISDDMTWNSEPNMSGFARSGYNTGGEVRCRATAYIYNYIMPEQFMQQFSQVELTKLKHRKDTTGKGAHEWQGTGGDLANIAAYETASISFNTWALRNGAKTHDDMKNINRYATDVGDADLRVPATDVPGTLDASSPEANPFFRRVQYLYTENGTAGATYGQLTTAVGTLTSNATSQQVMAVVSVPPGTASNVQLPNIVGVFLTARYQKGKPDKNEQDSPGGGKGKYQSTPYSGANSDYESAAKKRGHFYLGCKNPENPDCF
jgi:hypothetical protein